MKNIKVKVIKGWANNSDYLFSQNSENTSFKKELEKYKKENNLVEYSQLFKGGFYSKKFSDKKRVIIKGWYWRGSWSSPTKETYCYLMEKEV